MVQVTSFTSKDQLVIALRRQITTDEGKAIKALMTLFDYQTEDEKESEKTQHSNGVGFMQNDDRILTSLAKFYQDRGYLTSKQVSILMNRIGKYAGQLINHSLSKGMIVKEGKFYQFVR